MQKGVDGGSYTPYDGQYPCPSTFGNSFKGPEMARLNFLAASAAALVASIGTANAVAIDAQFNVATVGTLTADNGSVTTATTINDTDVDFVAAIVSNNIGLASFQPVVFATQPMGVFVGDTFTTAMGTFTETLTVTRSTYTSNSRSVLARGAMGRSNVMFDPTPVFCSASYTQNSGPGAQINVSYNDSTTPPPPRRRRFPSPPPWRSSAPAGLASAWSAAAPDPRAFDEARETQRAILRRGRARSERVAPVSCCPPRDQVGAQAARPAIYH